MHNAYIPSNRQVNYSFVTAGNRFTVTNMIAQINCQRDISLNDPLS